MAAEPVTTTPLSASAASAASAMSGTGVVPVDALMAHFRAVQKRHEGAQQQGLCTPLTFIPPLTLFPLGHLPVLLDVPRPFSWVPHEICIDNDSTRHFLPWRASCPCGLNGPCPAQRPVASEFGRALALVACLDNRNGCFLKRPLDSGLRCHSAPSKCPRTVVSTGLKIAR